MQLDNDRIEKEAYRLIRIECNRFDRETSNAELANYVMGIVDLQTELYKILESTKSTFALPTLIK